MRESPGRLGRLSATRAVALLAVAAVSFVTVGMTHGVSSSRRPAAVATSGALPAGARALVSRTLGRDDRRFALHRVGSGWVASNPAQGLGVSLTRAGVVVRSAGVSWAIGLRAIGRGEQLTRASSGVPVVAANSARLERVGLAEWYANGPLGLEQGFTIARPPLRGGAGALTLALSLPAGVAARLTRAGDGLVLERRGTTIMRYTNLSAVDASGHSLHAWLRVRATTLLLRVDDRGARYPIRIDPFVQTARLTASDGAMFDRLGSSVAVSGDGSTIVAGAPYVASIQGAVYVFTRPAAGWGNATETAKLTAADGAAGDALGSGVAISADGSTVLASAPIAKIGSNTRQGAVYVFVRSAGTWSQSAKLTASDGATDDFFGGDLPGGVAVSGDGSVVAVGVAHATIGANARQGALYLFDRPGGGWMTETEAVKLWASDGAANDSLGLAVALSNDGRTAFAGAPYASAGTGKVYVFSPPVLTVGMWAERAELTAAGGARGQLGWSLATSSGGGTLVAGAPYAPGGRALDPGAAYVFLKPPSVTGLWRNATDAAQLTSAVGVPGGEFGYSVGLSADGTAAIAGAYLFERPAAGWTSESETLKFAASDGAPLLLAAASSDGSTVAVGAPGTQIGATMSVGAVYVFNTPTTTAVSCHPAAVAVGHAASCTATVGDAYGAAAPTGTASFATDSSGSFGAGGSCMLTAAATPGVSSCSVSYVPSRVVSGRHTITARYGGDLNHFASQNSGPLTVTGSTTLTTVGCRPSSVIDGRTTTCTATVADAGGSGLTPTGSASFTTASRGSFSSGGSCSLAPTATPGTAACAVSYTPAAVASGTHALTARYAPDTNHLASHGATALSVARARTSTSVSCRPLSVLTGSTSMCTATVADTASGSITPTGTVAFGTNAIGSFPADESCTLAPTANAGVASCGLEYTPLAVGSGSHKITGNYAGDGNHRASRGVTLVAVKASRLPIALISSRRLVAHRGVLTALVSCPAYERFCDGTLTIYVAQRFQQSHARTAGTRTPLARAHFHVRGGKTQVVTLRPHKHALGSRKVVTVTIVLIARDQAGRSATATINGVTLVLRP